MLQNPRLRFGLLVCLLVSVPSVAFAQDTSVPVNHIENMEVQNDFIVGPARVILDVEEGSTYEVELQVTNRFGHQATFEISTEDFAAKGKEDIQFFLSDDPSPARMWLLPSAKTISLAHGDVAFLKVNIIVPKGVPPGDHQAAVIVKSQSSQTGSPGITIQSRVAAQFVLSLPGDVRRAGALTRLRTYEWFHWSLPIFFDLEAQNDGNIHMNPTGVVTIENMLGVTVDELPVAGWVLLQNSTRSIQLQWKPRFALGYYTARTNVRIFDEGTQPLSVQFWVIPLKLVLLCLFIIFSASFFVQYIFSRFELRRKRTGKKSKS